MGTTLMQSSTSSQEDILMGQAIWPKLSLTKASKADRVVGKGADFAASVLSKLLTSDAFEVVSWVGKRSERCRRPFCRCKGAMKVCINCDIGGELLARSFG